jgi:hypothetical protein
MTSHDLASITQHLGVPCREGSEVDAMSPCQPVPSKSAHERTPEPALTRREPRPRGVSTME